MANGKSETRRDAETGLLKSEPETKKCSNLIEKHVCDRQTQNLRLRDPLESSARFRDLGRICQLTLIFGRIIHHPNYSAAFCNNFRDYFSKDTDMYQIPKVEKQLLIHNKSKADSSTIFENHELETLQSYLTVFPLYPAAQVPINEAVDRCKPLYSYTGLYM